MKYNDKVRVIADKENNGFFVGVEGILKRREVGLNLKDKVLGNNLGAIRYAIEIEREMNWLWVDEDEIELSTP